MPSNNAVVAQADRVAESVGFDPATILTIITTIIGIIQSCKKPANKAAATAMIDDEFAVLVARKRTDKCPLQFRKVFKANGVFDKDEQNDLWQAIVDDAKKNRVSVAGALVA